MNKLIVALAIGLGATASCWAATPQERMKTCSADFKATGKPSAERQAYMKECLSAKNDAAKDAKVAAASPAASAAKPTQQQKMKSCSADFKTTGKPSADRKAYMKECLAA